MLDHNLSHLMAKALAELFRGKHEIFALKDLFPVNTPDRVWMEELSKQDRWVFISGDRRITKNRTEREAFNRSRLIGFFLAPGLYKSSPIKQMERILAQWEVIENQFSIVKGSAAFELQAKGLRLTQIKA